jgi:ribosome-associated protein
VSPPAGPGHRDVVLARGVVVPAAELEWRTSRAGGPGGQGVNTTDSRVELRWDVQASQALTPPQRQRVLDRLASRLTADGVLRLTGSEHRSQHRNREAVLARFRAVVGEALEPPTPRRPTRPSRAAKQRRLEGKRRRGEVKRLRRPPEV